MMIPTYVYLCIYIGSFMFTMIAFAAIFRDKSFSNQWYNVATIVCAICQLILLSLFVSLASLNPDRPVKERHEQHFRP
jgi:heme/copper-type cytochrome/quinol oxidase subunit 4